MYACSPHAYRHCTSTLGMLQHPSGGAYQWRYYAGSGEISICMQALALIDRSSNIEHALSTCTHASSSENDRLYRYIDLWAPLRVRPVDAEPPAIPTGEYAG